MTFIEEEVSVGRDLINVRKGGCGGRKEVEGAVKVRRTGDYSCNLRKEFLRN
jgi:hypothetical protein